MKREEVWVLKSGIKLPLMLSYIGSLTVQCNKQGSQYG
jgi:hypothetical protein